MEEHHLVVSTLLSTREQLTFVGLRGWNLVDEDLLLLIKIRLSRVCAKSDTLNLVVFCSKMTPRLLNLAKKNYYSKVISTKASDRVVTE